MVFMNILSVVSLRNVPCHHILGPYARKLKNGGKKFRLHKESLFHDPISGNNSVFSVREIKF